MENVDVRLSWYQPFTDVEAKELGWAMKELLPWCREVVVATGVSVRLRCNELPEYVVDLVKEKLRQVELRVEMHVDERKFWELVFK